MECRKHNHHGSKGVCPTCLRDKLSRLPNTTSYYIVHRSDDRSTSSTTVSSSPSSPAVKDHHRRAGSMSMSFAVREALSGNLIEALGGGGLKKSRSMAHVPRDYNNNTVRDSTTKKKTIKEKLKSTTVKKTGFWTKLLHLKGKGVAASAATDVVGGLVSSRQRVY
ncbi:PREDICTED: uncharacterized protein LOC104743872 [Camelina sativa]|uniref:Uncharacterized protein LOC104743872 n=1 Tax=Camelina sativa TaxID=90675 RepID=A0ABM0VYR9_CAMSA|nr:PREDICTED: uncharacterized protein LOC104743872 [Camelina sativa]